MRVVEDEGEGLDWEVFSQTDLARKVVDDSGQVVIRVGVSRLALIGKDLYLWMVPGPGLDPMKARELRKMWHTARGDRTVVITIRGSNKKARRWAEFFGFTYWKHHQGEDDLYVIRSSGTSCH